MTSLLVRAAPARSPGDKDKWQGRTREYDLIREFVVALLAVSLLTVALAVLFSLPDEKRITLSMWSTTSPTDFLVTAASELDGTSGTATYGAPYNDTPDAAQKLGPISLQHIAGVTQPVQTADDFVVRPLSAVQGSPALVVGLVLVPFLPGVRSIPRLIPIHKLIWRNYYRRSAGT